MEIASNKRTDEGKLRDTATTEKPLLKALEAMLHDEQEVGDFREFDPHVMAVTIRSAIDTLLPLFIVAPHLDTEAYARELVALFDRATRKEDLP